MPIDKIRLGHFKIHLEHFRVFTEGAALSIVLLFSTLENSLAINYAESEQGGNELDRIVDFSIKSQTLQSALLEFSKQSGIQLIFAVTGPEKYKTVSVIGKMTPRVALALLIRASGLEYEFSGKNTVTVRDVSNNDSLNSAHKSIEKNRNKDKLSSNNTAGKLSILEEIISIGTRSSGRTTYDTPVPVDIISSDAMRATGATETGRMLQALAPSFNFSSSSISDGTDAVRPATLRGLGPDQTLVLVNGKRRHTSALIHVNTSVGRGTSGVDMNSIPASSIGRIEVLRDGAAAQYGSDAIAGVINIILRDQASGGDATLSWGQSYEGDGETFLASLSHGFKIAQEGFLTLSAEYRNRQNSNRAGLSGCLQYEFASGDACAENNVASDPREESFDRLNFRIGDSDSEQKVGVINFGLPLKDTVNLYLFGLYSDRKNQSAGFYRRANQVKRTVLELYPNGFLPLINSHIKDYSLTAGIEAFFGQDWHLDGSISTGGNDFNFNITNSLNASLGASSPRQADAGTLKIAQTTLNLDIVKSFQFNSLEMNLAFGAEYREEKYEIEAGEEASYINGGVQNTTCTGCNVAADDPNAVFYDPGFQVFHGFSPNNAIEAKRNSQAIYLDLEIPFSKKFLLDAAVRFEEYNDFGSTVTGKIAARYELVDNFALRGSISSGFRAPSMQQKFFNSTSTQFVEINGVSVAQERGTFSNDSIIASALNIPKLKEETSRNFSIGFIMKPLAGLMISSDYYHIDIFNRIAITGSLPISNQFPVITAQTGITNGQFFTNIADTKTQGIDFVMSYYILKNDTEMLKISTAANWTETRIKQETINSPLFGVDADILFNIQDRSIIEDWQPSSRINATVHYENGPLSAIFRMNMFGSYTVCEGACDTPSGPDKNIQNFGSKWLTDIQINYFLERLEATLTLGANNIFNVYPDLNLIGQSRTGSIAGIVDSPGVFKYSRRSAPFGFNGGHYYIRATYNF